MWPFIPTDDWFIAEGWDEWIWVLVVPVLLLTDEVNLLLSNECGGPLEADDTAAVPAVWANKAATEILLPVGAGVEP